MSIFVGNKEIINFKSGGKLLRYTKGQLSYGKTGNIKRVI